MFESIRNEVQYNQNDTELMLESVESSDVRDRMLDDPEAVIHGAESDPRINELLESIPEDDEGEPLTAEDVKKLSEATLSDVDDIDDVITSGDYDDDNDLDFDTHFDEYFDCSNDVKGSADCEYETDSEDAIDDVITSESTTEEEAMFKYF